MIIDPVFIIGAPRSGTSMLFHVLRTTQSFWSLPSEGPHIWNRLCHPALNNWQSEGYYYNDNIPLEHKAIITKLYEQQIMPAWFWHRIDYSKIWRSNKSRAARTRRKIKGDLYITGTRVLHYLNPFKNMQKKRLLDKSVSNCLRLELVNGIFPDAMYIYIKREGISTITSLINGWLTPGRFVTFHPPEPINIIGYDSPDWKFAMPEGWQDFNNRHLADLCTWQWKTCQEKILDFRDKHQNRFIDVKLEELVSNPETQLKRIADCINVPYAKFYEFTDKGIPRVNETGNIKGNCFPFPEYLEKIREEIRPLMARMGYE